MEENPFSERTGSDGKHEDWNKGETPTPFSRRRFLRTTSKIGGGMLLAGLASNHLDIFKDDEAETELGIEEDFVEHTSLTEYSTGRLAGRNVNNDFRLLMGNLPTDPKFKDPIYIIPPRLRVNFSEQLDILWNQKIEISEGSRVVPETAGAITTEYREGPASRLSLEAYIEQIDQSINGIKESKDFWNNVAHIKGLNAREAELVESICRSFDGKDLMAYALTELMPSLSDGELNAGVMDFLLKNAGKEYVESIPARYDDKTSFGPYQFTDNAVYHVEERRGASITNMALPSNQRIPGSVGKLRGDDHHKAAFLFAVDNIANLVKMASRIGKLDVLNQIWRSKHMELIQIIATAHHGPYAVINGIPLGRGRRRAGIAEIWLANDAKDDFVVSARGTRYSDYARKTRANFIFLHESAKPTSSGINEPESEEKTEGHPASLDGTGSSKSHEMDLARQYNLSLMRTDDSVRDMKKKGYLVDVPRTGRHYYLDEIGIGYPTNRNFLYTARPWIKNFIEKESRRISSELSGAKLKVTSLTRSQDYQNFLRTGKYKGKQVQPPNNNASTDSAHPTGAVIDISKYTGTGKSRKLLPEKALKALRERLLELERMGVIEATEEMNQATFHIFVTPDYR